MYVIFSFIMAVVPAIFLVRYYYLEDKRKPEPKELILKVFIFGMLSIIPVIFLEIFVSIFNLAFLWNPILFFAFKAFIVAGLCEEYIKLVVVKKYAYQNIHFDEVMDGIVYTVIASLGFACIENIMYVMKGTMQIAIIRAFTAVPMHAACSGLMGYYIGKAKFASSKQEENDLIKKGFWKAVGIHGFYDFFLFISPILGGIFSICSLYVLFSSYQKLKEKIKVAIQEDISAGRV